MDIAELKGKVLAKHAGNPQRYGLADLHLNELERALAGLAAIGENITLDFGAASPAVQFPKMLYHAKELQPRIVNSSQEETQARAAGWNEFPGGVAPATSGVRMPGVQNPVQPPVAPPTTKVTIPVAPAPPTAPSSAFGTQRTPTTSGSAGSPSVGSASKGA